jgi:hypothetical protein
LTRWNAVSRIDVLESPAVRHAPGMSLVYSHNLPDQLGLTTDGDELTAVPSNIDPDDPTWGFLSYLPSSFPYMILEQPDVLILNPKGGLDIMSSCLQGASHTQVVEQNPLVMKVLMKDLSASSRNFYSQEKISFKISTIRTALRHDKPTFDLIVYPLTDVFGASGTGMSGFSENYSLTKEAFQDALTNLMPGGMVSMSFYILPPPRAEIRALSTWIELLEEAQKDPTSHIMALRSWGTITIFIKKSPFTQEESKALQEFSRERLFDLVYYPGIKKSETNLYNKHPEPIYHNFISQLLDRRQREKVYKDYLFRVNPVTDDRPFFDNFFKLSKIQKTHAALGNKLLPFLQGEPLVILLVIQAMIAAFLLILLPFFFIQRRKRIKKRIYIHTALYFGLIGSAFMFIEIAFIQKFIMFLGHPVSSSAIIIFSLLCASGLGSLVSKRIPLHKLEHWRKIMLSLCAGMTGLYFLVLLPLFFRGCIGFPLFYKIILTMGLIFPMGFVMGFPFPTGIRILAKRETNLIPWAWATNAFSSVVHSVLALLVAFYGGYSLVLGLAAAGYLLTLPFLDFSGHGNKSDS